MVKFSFIVPVYNVEKYLSDCLDSILNQTYDNFEVIVVNDGSPDNSQDIIDKYVKKDKRIKSFIKKNGGLSDARNYGVSKAKGEYLLFVDSDDTINNKLLEEINNVADGNDIVRFNMVRINLDEKKLGNVEVFSNLTGEEAFDKLITDEYFVTACASSYNRKFWLDNKFSYAVGRLHEDFGLTPYIYIIANKVTSIGYNGYNYFVRDNSIMTSNDIDKQKKKNEDCLYHYDRLMEWINKNNKVSDMGRKLFMSYISNSLITRCSGITDEYLKKSYMNELKKRNVGNNLIDNTLPRKIKKVVYKVSPYLYIKLFVK